MKKVYYEYIASIHRVVDGDTVDMEVDLGFSTHIRERFRLTGIDAPETNTKEGFAATQALQAFLPVGKVVKIVTTKDKREKFGRYLAVIFVDSAQVDES